MATQATILMDSGDPDPTWQLTDAQERIFKELLAAAPVPHTTISGAYRAAGYRGLMVRDGNDERWILYRGWIRGGVVTRIDEGRALEAALLETGRGTAAPALLDGLLKQIRPAA